MSFLLPDLGKVVYAAENQMQLEETIEQTVLTNDPVEPKTVKEEGEPQVVKEDISKPEEDENQASVENLELLSEQVATDADIKALVENETTKNETSSEPTTDYIDIDESNGVTPDEMEKPLPDDVNIESTVEEVNEFRENLQEDNNTEALADKLDFDEVNVTEDVIDAESLRDQVLPLGIPAPGYEDPTVPQILLEHDLTNGTSTSAGTFYTTQTQTYQVYFDGTHLGESVINGAHIDISGPKQYIEYIKVNPMSFIDRIETLVSEDGMNIITRVWLVDMDSSKKGSFPYTAKFNNRITPEGYEWTPKVELFVPDGLDSYVLMSTDETATVTAKVKHHFPFKYHTTNNLQTNRTDGSTTYGGKLNDVGTAISDPANVVFKFNLSSEDSIGDRLWSQEGWTGDGDKLKTRLIDKIIITDNLPTYKDSNGVTRTAVFDSTKNPGWTLSQDGTQVSTTVETIYDEEGKLVREASIIMRDDVSLILQFPDIAVTYNPETDTNESADIINNAEFLYELFNGTEYESKKMNRTRPYNNPEDGLTLKLRTSKLVNIGYLNKTTQNPNITDITVDHGGMHLASLKYNITITNPTSYPMKNIVLEDKIYDSRLFIYQFNTIANGANAIKEIIGIDKAGNETVIPKANINPWEKAYYIRTNEQSVSDILAMAEDVDSGAIEAKDTVPVDVENEAIKVVFNEDFVLEAGKSRTFSITMKYRDPYHLIDDLTDNLDNTASLSAKIILPENELGENITANESAEYALKLQQKSISMNKITWQFEGSQIGHSIRFPINLDLSNIGKNTSIKGGQIIDVLPVGITVSETSYGVSGGYNNLIESKQLINNYNNTGRQAVIINLKDFKAGEVNTVSGELVGVINENATTQFNSNASIDNLNRVYFRADSFGEYSTETVIENGKEVVKTYIDIQGEKVLVTRPLTEYGDVDLDGTPENKIIGASSVFNALLPEAVRGVKSIRTNPQNPWSTNPIYTKYGGSFQYKISAINNANTTLNNLYIYDRLPYIGDIDYINTDGVYESRNSAFRPEMTGPIMIAPESTLLLSNFIIEYRTDDNIPNSVTESMNQDGVWKQADEVGHAVEDWKSVKAFRIIMKEGIALPHYTSADFIVPMRAPNYMYDEDSGGRYANNSFAISYDAQTYGQSNIVSAALLLNIPVKKVCMAEAMICTKR